MKLATPVSSLFSEFGVEIAANSDVLEIRDHHQKFIRKTESELIFHSDLDVVSEWSETDLANLRSLVKFNLKAVSFHIASRYKENRIEGGCFVGLGVPYTEKELKDNANKNIMAVREIFGEIAIMVENMNHLGSDAYDLVSEPEFISEVVLENRAYLLLDLAHAKITCTNTRRSFDEYFRKLPLDRVLQIHLSKHSIVVGRAVDSHDLLDDFGEIVEVINRLPNIKYITVEYYKDAKKLIGMLRQLKDILIIDNFYFKRLEWDCNFFHREIGRLFLGLNALNMNFMKQINKFECVYCLSNDQSKNLEDAGFNCVDIKVDYLAELGFIPKMSFDFADILDLERIKQISSLAFKGMSRFYSDKHFSESDADELYIRWVDKLMNNPDSRILIIRDEGIIVGFTGISIKDGVGVIELIAVDRFYTGKGYGKRLVQQCFSYFKSKNVNEVTVSTQDKNFSAKRLYESAGFRLISKRYWYHWWRD
jgi:uncharacterized protein (UPF0276 family)/ribosomal protein S18 acetylase RimI-like enzyme